MNIIITPLKNEYVSDADFCCCCAADSRSIASVGFSRLSVKCGRERWRTLKPKKEKSDSTKLNDAKE